MVARVHGSFRTVALAARPGQTGSKGIVSMNVGKTGGCVLRRFFVATCNYPFTESARPYQSPKISLRDVIQRIPQIAAIKVDEELPHSTHIFHHVEY